VEVLGVDVVSFFDDLTGGHLLAWKASVASLVLVLAALQVALAGRFWADRGLPVSATTAAALHRWNGRALLVLSLVLGYVCLLTQAGQTDPLRILLHSILGGTLFVLLGAKLSVLHVVRGRRSWLPALGIALFVNYVALWVLSALDYVRNATAPEPGTLLDGWVVVAAVAAAVLGALGVAALVAVFTASDGTLTPGGYAAGLQPAAYVAAIVVALGALVVLLWMPKDTGKTLV